MSIAAQQLVTRHLSLQEWSMRPVLFGLCFAISMTVFAQSGSHTPRYYVQRAETHVQSGNWGAAKREIDSGLAAFPDDPDLRYYNGRYYYQAGRMQEARYNLVRAIQQNDQHFKAKRLLVDIEDSTHHYSSAICYINELLEFQPYDRDLWRRKIGLYRKLGNHVEADAALGRLAHIYPNDSLVRRDQLRRNRETWNATLQKSSLNEAADNLERWIDLDPRNREYYMELTNIYLRMGLKDKAIGTARRGLSVLPGDSELKNKVVAIFSSDGQYTQALAFARQHNMGERVYRDLMQQIADDARLHDPYEANGRLYEQTRDNNALTYLLNTSLSRGYADDARYYLQETMKRDGRTLPLLAKLYALEKREGNEQAMMKCLEEIYEKSPADAEVSSAYVGMILELANRNMANEQWADAIQYLDKVIAMQSPADETWPAAVSRKIVALGHLGRYDEARQFAGWAMDRDAQGGSRYASAYEELIANQLRLFIEDERYEDALADAEKLLELLPYSETALRCCINTTQTLKRDGEFHLYAERGYRAFPDNPYFIVKYAVALQGQGRTEEALALLGSRISHEGWSSPQFATAFVGMSQEWAMLLLKNRMPELALAVADSALVHKAGDRELLYIKGLVYEQMKDFGKAYEYQYRYYNPSNAEQQDWLQHMRYMRFRSFRNRVDATYTRAVYDTRNEELASVGHLYSLAAVSYSRLCEGNTYMGEITYKGMDGYHTDDADESGGVGLQLMAQWEHVFDERWSGMANVSYATRYMNKLGINVGASYAADYDWTYSLRLGYRLTPKTYLYLSGSDGTTARHGKHSLLLLSPSAEKSWGGIKATASADLALLRGNIYYNVGAKGKLFINEDNISSVSLIAGFGSFPDLALFDHTALRSVSHTNAMVGFDAQYLCTRNMYVGLTGTWNTCYNPRRLADGSLASSYRNIFTMQLGLHVAF